MLERAPLAVFALLVLHVPAAHAWQASGRVRGGGEAAGLVAAAMSSRNLRTAAVDAAAPVDAATGAFRLEAGGPAARYVLLVQGCSPADVTRRGLDGCRLLHPRHDLVLDGASALAFQVPDLGRADAIWRGGDSGRPWLRWAALGLVLALAGVGWRLRTPDGGTEHDPSPRPPLVWLALGSAAVLVPNLGSSPLDLQEYSYFHEAVRPATTAGVFTDFTRAELAHGPVMPLLLRAVAALSDSPWVLRAPSVVFGALFVVCVFLIARQALGALGSSVASGLALLLPIAVHYARDGTPYALAGLCTAAGVLALVRALEAPRPGPWLVALAAIQVVGFFAHYAFAFVSAALLAAVVVRRPARLGDVLLSFAAAAAVPALVAPELALAIESSGTRFALMSPVYPESPGLLAFAGTFLAVLTGVPANAPWLLALTLPLWAFGLAALFRRSPLVAWIAVMLTLFVVAFLVFTHTMSTTWGGGRVYYAFRWALPFLLGLLLPIAASALTPARWGLVALAPLLAWQSVSLVLLPVRPAQAAVADLLAERGRDGDALAVLPAMFYGDPLLYHVTRGAPPELITRGRAQPLAIGGATVFGPLMEGDLTLETELDRLAFRRVWLVAYREENLGVPKFDAGVTARTVAWLDHTCRRLDHTAFPFVDVWLHACPPSRAWGPDGRLAIDLGQPVAAERYLGGGLDRRTALAAERLEVVVPGDAAALAVYGSADPALGPESLAIDGVATPVTFERGEHGEAVWRAALPSATGDRVAIGLRRRGALAGCNVRIEVVRSSPRDRGESR